MKPIYLDFEQPIAELNNKIEELRLVQGDSAVDISDEIKRLQKKAADLTKSIFAKLTPDFQELHGDRHYADDHAIIGGVARFNGHSVVVIGHQKGRDTKEKLHRNFGMPRPEGYRKALRLMHLAEKFRMPVLAFVDTPGAYPGIGAEERNQSEAIGKNLYELTKLHTPVICTIIGEGGSGGALAIAVGDYINMLQYSTYSVISPEGCASILWKTAEKAPEAAAALGITADRLHKLGLVDNVIKEPLGGAHRDYAELMNTVKTTLEQQITQAQGMRLDDLLSRRFDRIMNYGQFIDKNK